MKHLINLARYAAITAATRLNNIDPSLSEPKRCNNTIGRHREVQQVSIDTTLVGGTLDVYKAFLDLVISCNDRHSGSTLEWLVRNDERERLTRVLTCQIKSAFGRL